MCYPTYVRPKKYEFCYIVEVAISPDPKGFSPEKVLLHHVLLFLSCELLVLPELV